MAQHGTQAPATARHTSPGVALRVSPLSMGGNQNEKPTHASSSLAFYRKEKSSWLNRSVLGTPKPQGMEAGEGLSAEFGGSHHGPCTTIRISWVLCGHKGNVDVFLCQSWRSTRAVRQTMPARLTSHGLGATICFAKATVWNSWLNSRSPYGGASPVLPSRRADYRSPQSTPSSWTSL